MIHISNSPSDRPRGWQDGEAFDPYSRLNAIEPLALWTATAEVADRPAG